MRKPFIFILLFVVAGCSENRNDSPEVQRWEEQAARVTIIRDTFGVPHIYGKSDADAVFGMLYAQCEDDFKRVERNYIWATGRLAEVEGKQQLYSDLRARLFMTEQEARQYYDESPEWLQKLCNAFADGINYYLHTHPEVKPALFTRFEPWMPMYFSEGSIGGDLESVSTTKIRDFYDESNLLSLTSENMDSDDDWSEPQGSNGFAISGDLSVSGNAMLLINPHTSFYFRPEIHVVSEEGLNAYGAVTWGQFFIYQGFNENNGWMHTSSYADVIDEFVEKIIEDEGKYSYQYGEELRVVENVAISLQYKDENGFGTRDFTGYRTHHGPVTAKNDTGWVATALMWEPSKALQQAFIRTKTKNYQEFREMMEFKTNSSNNTVYADADGTIAYFHGNFMPKRDVRFDYSKPVDGSNPATDWQGLHEVDELIQLLNPPNGWIQNCNSTPFTAALDYSPKEAAYPYYMATEPENFRGVHAVKVLQDSKDFTIDKLIATGYDPYLPAFEKLIPGLVAAYDASPAKYTTMKSAIEILRSWDFKTDVSAVGMSLAHFYGMRYSQVGVKPEGMSFMERINYYGTETHYQERLEVFSEVLTQMEQDFGSWNIPWGEINRFQRLSGDIALKYDDDKESLPVGMASGNWGALASFGSRGNSETKKIYGMYGNSFVAAVAFGDRVKAKSILAGGQSGDINSPHFLDQADMYTRGEFKTVNFYRDEVEANEVRRYQPGEITSTF